MRDQSPPSKPAIRRLDSALPGLLVRAGSAVLLAATALLLTYAGIWPFACLITIGAIIGVWEWARMTGNVPTGAVTLAQTGVLVAAGILTALGASGAALGIVTGAAAAIGAWSLARDNVRHARLAAFGMLYLGLPLVALIVLRSDPDYGLAAILFLFAVVWTEDTAAYCVGSLVGGPKLAPSISPGKTWSGSLGGLLVPALAAPVFALALREEHILALSLVAIGLALAAQLGDLFESAIKRAFGIKDASNLIPGHGGLLDRIDGFIGAALAAGALVLLRDSSNPGSALMVW